MTQAEERAAAWALPGWALCTCGHPRNHHRFDEYYFGQCCEKHGGYGSPGCQTGCTGWHFSGELRVPSWKLPTARERDLRLTRDGLAWLNTADADELARAFSELDPAAVRTTENNPGLTTRAIKVILGARPIPDLFHVKQQQRIGRHVWTHILLLLRERGLIAEHASAARPLPWESSMANRWFMDTEFDENGVTIKLISIALVSQDGREYYAEASDGWRPEDCSPWVQENVLPKLVGAAAQKTRAQIRDDVTALLLGGDAGKPELWAYFADYDWVVFCQLFGRMTDLPAGIPMWCRDLKQTMQERGIEKEALPPQEEDSGHSALADARWVRAAWRAIDEGG